MIKTLTIGNVELPNRYVLAPMAGVTDLPFRLLCKEQGAGLLCMEMISAKALRYKNKNTKALLAIDPREYPVSLQLFGEDPDIISEQAKRIEELPFQILDINMGCPVPKIVKNGEGSALMLRPELVYEIVSKTAKAIKKPRTPFQNGVRGLYILGIYTFFAARNKFGGAGKRFSRSSTANPASVTDRSSERIVSNAT